MSFAPLISARDDDALDVKAYVLPIWRRRFLIIAIVVVAGVATYFVSASRHKQYQASTEIYIQSAVPQVSSTTEAIPEEVPSADQLADIAQLVTAAPIQNAVENQLGESPTKIGSVSAAASSTSDFVNITATSENPAGAATLANAYANQYLKSRDTQIFQQARASIAAAQTTLASVSKSPNNPSALATRQSLESSIQGYRQSLLNPQNGATQTSKAVSSGVPVSPRPKRDAIFGAVIGLLAAIIVAFGLELSSTRLESPEELEKFFGRPVVAVLPRVSEPDLFVGNAPEVPEPFREALRMLRFQLKLNPDWGVEPKTVLVTSGLENEGKSTVVRDLALTYAQSGQRVLIIDADLRKPSVAREFNLRPTHSIDDVFIGDVSLEDAVASLELSRSEAGSREPERRHGGALDVLVPGPRASASVDLLASRLMRDLIDRAATLYDVVLIDTAPLLMVADTTPLLPLVDSVLVVSRFGVVTRQQANRVTELIRRLGAVKFTGVIANDHGKRRGAKGYGYGYGYGKGYGKSPSRDALPLTAPEVSAPGSVAND